MIEIAHWKDLKISMKHASVREACIWLIENYIKRYVPDISGNRTFCNIFFTDVVQQLHLEGPYHWVDDKGNPMRFLPGTAVKGRELSANGLIDWFRKYGAGYGWLQVERNEAEEIAKQNKLVAVTYHSGTPGRSGHIAVLLEDGSIAQAGAGMPFVGHSVETGFGNHPIEFWAYVEEKENSNG
jgi:hypothetical protein